MIVSSSRQAKAQHNLRTLSGRKAKASHGRIRSGRQAKSSQRLRVESGRQARSRQTTQAFLDVYLVPSAEGVKALRRGPVVTVTHYEGTAPTTMAPLGYEIQRRRNQPTQWSIELSNHNRAFREGGPWDGKLDGNPYNASWEVQRHFTIGMSVAEMPPYVFPFLLQFDLEVNQKRKSSTVTLSGTDYADLLLQPDQGMDDVTLGVGSPPFRSSLSVMAETLAEFNVNDYELGIESFIIQKMHRQGVPLDWLRELLWVTQSNWRFEGKRFIAYNARLKTNADWHFDSNLEIVSLSFRKAARNIKNKFTVTRLDDVSGLLLDLDTTEDDGVTPGWQGPFDFAFPSCNFRTKEVRVLGGRLYNWIFLDDNDETVGFSLGDNLFVHVGSPPATKIKFIYEPTIEYQLSGRPYGYKVQIDGRRWVDHPDIGLFDTAYTATKSDPTSQAQHGKRPEPPIDNTLIPNLAVAQTCVNRLCEEGVRRGTVLVIQTPFPNPYIYPGQTISVTDYKLGLDRELFFVEAVTFSGKRKAHTMTLECTRPLTDA